MKHLGLYLLAGLFLFQEPAHSDSLKEQLDHAPQWRERVLGSGAFSPEHAELQLPFSNDCPEERRLRLGFAFFPKLPRQGSLLFFLDQKPLIMQSPSLSPGFSWFELIAPPGQHTLTLQLLHEATTFSVPLLLLEETVENCSEPAPLCLGAELPLPSCQELEPLVCQLLQVESEILCLQLALNQFSLQLERQGPQASNFLSPWHAQVFAAAAPRLEQKEGLQARLFQELKELSRKKPTQYSSYLHHHQALEAAYGKQLQSLLERDP